MIKNTMFLPGIMTDHRACQLTAEMSANERGVGFWKFNNSLLEDSDFIDSMIKEIQLPVNCTYGMNNSSRWEKIKSRIKKYMQNYARRKAGLNKEIISNLSEKVQDFESRLPLTLSEMQILEQTKKDLDEKLSERAKGLMFRSKANWYEYGEKGTKYFLNLE